MARSHLIIVFGNTTAAIYICIYYDFNCIVTLYSKWFSVHRVLYYILYKVQFPLLILLVSNCKEEPANKVRDFFLPD